MAMRLVDLCGLGENDFALSADKCAFKFLGYDSVATPDVMIVESKSKDLVIIFEDKTGQFKSDGYLGQIVAELLMCHYHNHFINNNNAPTKVYLLRCFQFRVTAFSMSVCREALNRICTQALLFHGRKFDLISDIAEPLTNQGYNLLIPEERQAIILLIESIKKDCVDRMGLDQ